MQKILCPLEKIVVEQLGMARQNAAGENLLFVVSEIAPSAFDAALSKTNSDDGVKIVGLKKKLTTRYKGLGVRGSSELLLALSVWCAGNGV